MHFSLSYLILGLLAVVQAAPFPATNSDSSDLTLSARTDSSKHPKPPFRIVINFMDWNCEAPDSVDAESIPVVVKQRIVAHLNRGGSESETNPGSETKTGTPTESQFRTKPLTVEDIKFFPGSVWGHATNPATAPFRFAWWDAQAQGFKWTDDTAGRKLGVARVELVGKGGVRKGIAETSEGIVEKSEGIAGKSVG